MPIINDPEFGEVVIRKYRQARSIKATVAPNGKLRISAPQHAPNFLIKSFIKQSRLSIRQLIDTATPKVEYTPGMTIGKSHSLLVTEGSTLQATIKGNYINLTLPKEKELNSKNVQDMLRPYIIKALKKQAKAHLPRRLEHLAREHNFTYNSLKFSHASSRWGSCSSQKTITLNIALMKLPFDLIDYVLIHELAHTIEMNHSKSFWAIVEEAFPSYRTQRRLLKQETPNI